jgi:uncharacterized protein YkwD
MRVRALVAVVVAVVLVLGFVPTASGAATESEVAAALFKKINNKRAKKHGLPRLQEWSVIVQEAEEHSDYQAQQGDISHDGFDGRANRIMNAGNGINAVCENVAFVSGYTDLRDVVRVFFRGWDNSPPHHRCLFDKIQNSVWAGVGITRVGGSTYYATFLAAADASPNQP